MKLFYSILQKIIENCYKIKKNEGNILMFHQVNDNKRKWKYDNISISFENFKYLIKNLEKQEKNFKNIKDIGNFMSQNDIFLTFDDCFEEVYTIVYPFLKENKIPFCIFITIDLIDREGYLSRDMLLKLAAEELCTIGSHTLTHPLLRFVENSAKEIEESKIKLEKIINKAVEYFAYPYGSIYAVTKKNLRIASETYKFSFSTLNSHFNLDDIKNRNFIPRININDKNYKRILKEN